MIYTLCAVLYQYSLRKDKYEFSGLHQRQLIFRTRSDELEGWRTHRFIDPSEGCTMCSVLADIESWIFHCTLECEIFSSQCFWGAVGHKSFKFLVRLRLFVPLPLRVQAVYGRSSTDEAAREVVSSQLSMRKHPLLVMSLH